MAAGRVSNRPGKEVDYVQLHSFSSVVLYDTQKRQKKKSVFYEVERIITRRKISYECEYLIKWKGWPLETSSWEPSDNLTPDLLRNYENPPICEERLQVASSRFCCGVLDALKSQRSTPVYINIEHDIWRNITYGKGVPSEHRGHLLLQKNELARFKYLPENWWYFINEDGDGIQVDFPLKAKPVLSWSPKRFEKRNGVIVEAKRFPLEKVCLTVIRQSCTADNI